MFKSRTVDRMAFSAEGLTPGVKLQNSSPFREFLTTRPKLVSKKVKCDVRIPPFAFSILAIDDLGFRRVHLEAALFQSSLQFGLEAFSLLLGSAGHQPIIGIPTPREVGVCPFHPELECVVQEKIR